MLPFDRFSVGAQDCAKRAFEILQRYGSEQVDTEHLLLALLEQPEGVSQYVPDQARVDQALMKKRLDDVLQALPKAAAPVAPSQQVFITPRVKNILELADAEATRLKADHISTEHIFRGILSERNTAVAGILSEAGVTQA